MARLFRFVLAVIVFLAGAIVVVRLIGSARASPLAALFSFPDGTPCDNPCLFGIRAGETRATDAIRILESHPLTRNLTMVDWPFTYMTDRASPESRGVLIVFRADGDGMIDEITLVADAPKPSQVGSALNLLPEPASLGDVLVAWGNPDISWTNSQLSTYSYGHTLVNLDVVISRNSRVRLEETSPIVELGMATLSSCPISAYRQQFGPWLGLTTFQHYEKKQEAWGWTWIDRTNQGVLCQP